ncbi:N-acetyltransferase [Megasphaera cerevisiae]|uniref:N-acetyltransferase n=1 Tax=Megasphaera cerevisiae TaxID=39029 RepID=UPI000A9B1A76|nr:N-acetyltransferase [Megasphaera cerevisiae]
MRDNCKISKNAIIKKDVIIGNNVVIEDNVYIDYGAIIYDNVHIKSGTTIGARCILGEHLMDFYENHTDKMHPLIIGKNSLIRSETIIYGDTIIGDYFQSGHRVTIREKTYIGNHVSIGTISDIQGNCRIGNYVRMHSNVHIGQCSVIDDYVWIFPYVVLTNDPTPPSEILEGVHVHSFAIIATAAIVMPGIEVGQDSLIGAGAIVTKNVDKYVVILGNPGKSVSDVRKIKNKVTGEPVYPWRNYFNRAMPWEHIGFKQWYDSLDITNKIKIE